MTKHLFPLMALLLGSVFLMLAGGIHGLILPLRGTSEGFSSFSLGLLGMGWAAGYVTGCLLVPKIVMRVGHIRSFGALAALAVVSVLLSLLIIHPLSWIPLRALAGFCFAGAAMIVESWISERSEPSFRGRVFATYTMLNLTAQTAGQLLLIFGDTGGYQFFVLAAVFYALAVLPSALSKTAAPRPLVQTKLDLPQLWKNSPIAVVSVFLVGTSNSAFGTLGAVFGQQIGLNIPAIALFMSLSILVGALMQLPVGWFSDRTDRRIILVVLAVVAILIDLFFIIATPRDVLTVLIAIALFGGMIFAMYPVIVAHANDHADDQSFLKISGGLLLIFGIGTIVGPLLAGVIMTIFGSSGLFIATFGTHTIIVIYAIWRITRRAAVAQDNKTEFVTMPAARIFTPETSTLDPRIDEEE